MAKYMSLEELDKLMDQKEAETMSFTINGKEINIADYNSNEEFLKAIRDARKEPVTFKVDNFTNTANKDIEDLLEEVRATHDLSKLRKGSERDYHYNMDKFYEEITLIKNHVDMMRDYLEKANNCLGIENEKDGDDEFI